MLDAGCGNGSQSVAYTALGLEVIAVDLSSDWKRAMLTGSFIRAPVPNESTSCRAICSDRRWRRTFWTSFIQRVCYITLLIR